MRHVVHAVAVGVEEDGGFGQGWFRRRCLLGGFGVAGIEKLGIGVVMGFLFDVWPRAGRRGEGDMLPFGGVCYGRRGQTAYAGPVAAKPTVSTVGSRCPTGGAACAVDASRPGAGSRGGAEADV